MATPKRALARKLTLDYTPRPPFEAFHQRSTRWSCLVCHRRAGKTVACIYDMIIRALYTTKKNAQYGYVGPFRQQVKRIAWRYLKEATEGMVLEVRESDLSVQLANGALISLYGSDNPNALRGMYFDGLIVDEFADCRPSLWAEVLLPTLADRKGWCVFIGTPKGMHNQFYEFHKLSQTSDEWFDMLLSAETSNILAPDELAQLRDQMSEAQYEQEMLCSFTAAMVGVYYAKLIRDLEEAGRIAVNVDYNPDLPVIAAADIGFSDSTVIWFAQEYPDRIEVIDCLDGHGEQLSWYVDRLNEKPFEIETLWLPHDARAKTLQTGRSTIEQLLAAGFKCDIVPRLSVQQGIEATRMMLPLCRFNQTTCRTGVEGLRVYRRKYDEINRVYSDTPLHDWASDFADAFRYLSLVMQTRRTKAPDALPGRTANIYTLPPPEMRLAEMFAANERGQRRSIRNMRV